MGNGLIGFPARAVGTALKRLLAYMLLPALVFGALPSVGAEGQSREEILSNLLAERFGSGAVVETDESSRPVTVNGYPFREVEASFNVRGVDEKFSALTDFVDYPFWQPATEYCGALANMSLIMALCSARDRLRDENPETFDPAQNLEAYLVNAGFSDIRKDDYSKETSIYTISTAMGIRRMEHGGEEPFTLIAVGVCGGAYGNEWQSNITAGTGDLHEGFRSASDLVIDRIAGYIMMQGIKGRIKIWISGFSRAAAVANLTAGRLTHKGGFQKEDVYAYTFATPAAVYNPPDAGDENIWNILCPTDVVPQVMPAEWGYGRYGKDLYLPVPEFSSMGEMLVLEREEALKDTFGIDIHYSASLNLRMRLLVSMVLEAIGNRDYYAREIQDTAVGVMQRMTTSNLLSTMRTLLLSVQGSNREDRAVLDRLLNFMFRVFGNAMTRTELADVNRNSGSNLMLLFTEHREDSYLASMNFILEGIFEEDREFTYVMAKGPLELEMTVDEEPGWSMVLKKDGTIVRTAPGNPPKVTENPTYQEYFMERVGNVSIAAVPHDLGIHLAWKAAGSGTAEVRQVRVGLHASTKYPGATSGEMKVSPGDTGTAYSPRERDGLLPEGFREETYQAGDITGFLGISAPFASWRILVVVILLLVGAVAFLMIRLVALFFPNREKKGSKVWILLAVFCVAVAEAEGAFWLLADKPLIRFAWKALAGAAILAVFFLRRNRNEAISGSILPGLITAIAGDLVMTFAFLPGVAVFLLGHVLLIAGFLKGRPMNRAQWIQWAVLSAITAGLIILAFVPELGLKAWAAAVYAPVLLLMVYSVNGQNPRIRYAAGFFLVSDLLLGVFLTVWKEPLAHILCMILFSASLMLLALREKVGVPKAMKS